MIGHIVLSHATPVDSKDVTKLFQRLIFVFILLRVKIDVCKARIKLDITWNYIESLIG